MHFRSCVNYLAGNPRRNRVCMWNSDSLIGRICNARTLVTDVFFVSSRWGKLEWYRKGWSRSVWAHFVGHTIELLGWENVSFKFKHHHQVIWVFHNVLVINPVRYTSPFVLLTFPANLRSILPNIKQSWGNRSIFPPS